MTIARKIGFIGRSQVKDFFTRILTVQNGDRVFVEAREFDIPYIVGEGLSTLGITYSSDFFEHTGEEAKVGVKTPDIEVLVEFPFGFQFISAVAAKRCQKFDKLRVLVAPTLLRTCDLVLGRLASKTHKVSSFSVPQELCYMGTGTLGVDRMILKEDFEGDIGEDGRPYTDYFERLEVFPVKMGIVDGEEFNFKQIVNKPILIGNRVALDDQKIRESADRIAQRGWRRKELKTVRVQTTHENEVKVRSHDKTLMSGIARSGYKFIYDSGMARAYDPSLTLAIISIGTAQANVQLMNKLKFIGINPKVISLPRLVGRISLGKKLSKLYKKGYELVIFVGPKELETGRISLKDLRQRRQVEVSIEEIDKIVRQFFLNVDKNRPVRTVLVQEMGFPGYERRLFEPGRDYVNTAYGLNMSHSRLPIEETNKTLRVVKVNYRDMVRLLSEGVADEAVLGYDRFINALIETGQTLDLVRQVDFNSYASLRSLPISIHDLQHSKCKLVLAEDISGAKSRNFLHTEYSGVACSLSSSGEIDRSIRIRKIYGCAESYLGLILDAMTTGRSLQDNGKYVLKEVLESSAIVASRKA